MYYNFTFFFLVITRQTPARKIPAQRTYLASKETPVFGVPLCTLAVPIFLETEFTVLTPEPPAPVVVVVVVVVPPEPLGLFPEPPGLSPGSSPESSPGTLLGWTRI